jgi:2,4'-dihydroxyacetophenone dioxygenase
MKNEVFRTDSKGRAFLDIVLKSTAPEGGFQLGADECPWIPGDPGAWNKFMLFDLRHNSLATLFKINPGEKLPPHYHSQPVVGYVIQGEWKYEEYDWIARPGSTVFEPAGEVHTLVNIGLEPMISFFHVTGPEITVDQAGHVTRYIDCHTTLNYTRDYCKQNGIDDSFIATITR